MAVPITIPLDVSVVSILILAAASTSIPPADEVMAIDALSVPFVLTILISSLPAVADAAILK